MLVVGSLRSASAEDRVNLHSTPVFEEAVAARDVRMQWFRDAKFGMFIHWGLYSQLGGEWKNQTVTGGAEWIQKYLSIPTSEYEKLAKSWEPTHYDPRSWVKLMKRAGVRYACITSKHHDGFCLWPTRTNKDWNISITPYGKDLLKPLAEACREEGLRFSLYHSVLDWRHEDWPARLRFNDHAAGKPDKERFKKQYLFPQLEELFTNYGDIGMLWLDGTWDVEWTSKDGEDLEAYIRKLQPGVVLNNRSGYKPPQPDYDFKIHNRYSYIFSGDYISPEGEVPPTGLPGIDWETCQTMQLPNNWGYNRLVGFRPFNDLLRQLVDVVSKGGNMLLNIGPQADGRIPAQAVTCLEKFGDWMEVNAESIHGTTASPFEALPFEGRCTRKGNKLYFHVFEWPEDNLLLIPLKAQVLEAYCLADPETALTTRSMPKGIELQLPTTAPDDIVSVLVLEVKGELEITSVPKLLSQGLTPKVSTIWQGRPELCSQHITDGNEASMWAAEQKARSAEVELDLGAQMTLHSIRLSDAPYERTRSFQIEVQTDGDWRTVGAGKKIGPGYRLRLDGVRAQAVRLRIQDALDTPTLAEFQVYGEQ